MRPDIEIAQAATPLPIGEVAAGLGIPDEALVPYGRYKAKVALRFVDELQRSATLAL
jgi:formate--tetrahydrofolate ligase